MFPSLRPADGRGTATLRLLATLVVLVAEPMSHMDVALATAVVCLLAWLTWLRIPFLRIVFRYTASGMIASLGVVEAVIGI